VKLPGQGFWRFAVAALVIAFVATRVPWVDRAQAAGSDRWVEGRLSGEWRSDQVSFLPKADVEVPRDWSAPWVSSLREGEQATLTRREGAFWEPGLLTVLKGLRPGAMLGMLCAVLGGLFCGVTRWWRLLRVCGAATEYRTALRLTLLGVFFNLVVPGLTGGDVVKAGLAAKEHPENRSAAVMAVGLDRLIGFFTLLWIAAITAWVLRDRLGDLLVPLVAASLLSTASMLVLGVPRLRDALGAQRVLAWIPAKLAGIVESLKEIADRPLEVLVAVILSVVNHACIGLAVFAVARGIGEVGADTGFVGCLSATVVASAVSAIPLVPGGWGVGEEAYGYMFAMLGAGKTVGIAISVTYRLCQTGVSLICGLALWRGGSAHEWKQEAEGLAPPP